ncbi:putative kinesin-like protein [Helianthus annuus]|nr:putative kinesin-like protein [Helianthus annuus]KAJ0776839.1 putative kinesin-like protein [Helianthus annuus]
MLEDKVHQTEKLEEEISVLQTQLLQLSFDADEEFDANDDLESGDHSAEMTADMDSLISPVRQPHMKHSGEQEKGSVAKLFEQGS